jgi:hypothetical protein
MIKYIHGVRHEWSMGGYYGSVFNNRCYVPYS